MDESRRVFGVVLGEQSVRRERVVHAVAERVAKLALGHPAVQRERDDQFDVVDPCCRGHLEHLLDDQLAVVGPFHRGERKGDVVERDGELHAGAQQGREGLGVAEWVAERSADRATWIFERIERLRRVDHPASLRQALQREPLPVPEQGRRCGAIDLQHEPRSRAHRTPFRSRRSKTTFTAPRRPAAPAWARASP